MLRGSKEELALKATNYWVYPSGRYEQGDMDAFLQQSLDEVVQDNSRDFPCLFISFPSTKDPTWEDRYPGRQLPANPMLLSHAVFELTPI